MNWFSPIGEGILQGIAISLLSFGPGFFTLILTGLKEGFRRGLLLAVGIIFSETIIAMLYFFGLAGLFSNRNFMAVFSLACGIGLVILGIRTFKGTYNSFLRDFHIVKPGSKNILKGFLFNLINPATLVLWLIVISGIAQRYMDVTENQRLLMFINLSTTLVVIFLMDTGKVFVSHRLGRNLKTKVYYIINRYFGIILLLIGLVFIARFIIAIQPVK